MGQIQTPEYGLRLAKFFQMSGETQALRAVEEVVFPVVLVGDISQESVRGELFAIAFQQPLNAANFSKIAFVNPVGSGLLYLPQWFRMASNLGQSCVLQIEPSAAYVPLIPGVSLNDGLTVSPPIAVGSNPAAGAAFPGAFVHATAVNSHPSDLDLRGMRMPPGRALVVYSGLINCNLNSHLIWKSEPTN